MTQLPAILVTVLTVLSPIITSVFTHVQMDSTAKKNIAFAVSFVIAGAYEVMTGGIKDLTNLAEIAAAVPVIFTLQQLVFGAMLKSVSDVVEAKVGVQPKAAAAAVAGPAAAGPVVNVYPSGAVVASDIAAAVAAANGASPAGVKAPGSVTPAAG